MAQTPLSRADDDTRVERVSFRFVDTQTFEESRLKELLSTRAPTFLDRARRIVPLMRAPEYPLQPIELQRDVVRLRNFYNRQGFPDPRIDYPASQLNPEDNTIHVIFTVDEGDPIIIQDVGFFNAEGSDYAANQFDGQLRESWIRFRDRTTFREGERYTSYNRTRIEDDVLRWMRNNGFAFADIDSEVTVDSTALTADIEFRLDPGPRGRIAEIQIEGNETVSDDVILRELPLSVGDRYSHDRLIEGQRKLFGLNMFRVALAEVPDQEPSEEVTIRYQLRESDLRYVSANTGYGRNTGVSGEGEWTHRNFMGGGRDFSVSALAHSGLFSAPQDRLVEDRRFRGAVSLRQPYVFMSDLSGVISPFIEYQANPLLAVSDMPFGVNLREFGVNSRLLYEIYPYRTVTFQHTFTRTLQFSEVRDTTAAPDEQLQELRDLFDRSTFSLSAQLGRADDYVTPRRGFLIRPSVDFSPGILGSDLEYVRLNNELTGYVPIRDDMRIAGRLSAGQLFPIGQTRAQLDEPITENRMRRVNFYAGGSNDLRGWAPQLAGPKSVREFITLFETGERDTTFAYGPEGGTSKVAANTELRMPFPGLGSLWRTAVFVDAAHVGDELDLSNLRVGTGGGIRYQTAVGYVRLDLAMKVNPDERDLRNPREFFQEGTDAPTRWWRRFRVHLSIGQAF